MNEKDVANEGVQLRLSLACAQVASLIPRPTLESTYGLFIPRPPEGQPQDRPPTSEELLNAYGCE